MEKPTKQEYEEACNNIDFCKNTIRLTRQEIDKKLDELCSLKNQLNTYQEFLNQSIKIKDKYEIYEGLEKEGEKNEEN